MEDKKKLETYLEDNSDLIFGTECLYGNFDIKLRDRLENSLINKKDSTIFVENKDDDQKPNTL